MAEANVVEANNLPQVNDYVENVYLFEAFRTKDNQVSFKLRAFPFNGTNFPLRHFFEAKPDENVCMFYYRMPRVLFLGAITGVDDIALEMETQFFEGEYGRANGCGYHVFVGVQGIFTSIMCKLNRNGEHIEAIRYVEIHDVFPRFRRLPRLENCEESHRLLCATKVQIVNTTAGNRDGARCGYTVIGGVFHLDETKIIENRGTHVRNLYRNIQNMTLPYFGIYLHSNAKLLFVDTCRKCQFENLLQVANNSQTALEVVHHNRTLCQSGAFLIVEGYLCYQFAKYFGEYYTASDLEERRIIPQSLITSKTSPLFFLRAIAGCDSIAWCLSPIEDKIEDQHWVLTIPDGGEFDAIEEFDMGYKEVLHRQSDPTAAPWDENVIEDCNYIRPQDFANFRAPRGCTERIGTRDRNEAEIVWQNIERSVPPPRFRETVTPIPQHNPITNYITISLLLGTQVVIPSEYQLIGQTAFHLFNARYIEYYRINKLWYRRVNTTRLPLILRWLHEHQLPGYLQYSQPVNRQLYGGYIVSTYDVNHVAYYVVEFYWDSYIHHVIRRQRTPNVFD